MHCQRRGLPQGRFAWACRLHPNVRRVYELLHGTNDLVCAMDNPFFAKRDQAEADSNRNWPHVDHNSHDVLTADWDVWQGLLFVWSSEPLRASTTVVWPRSHTFLYPDIMDDERVAEAGRKGKHFTQLPDRLQPGWRAEARRLPVPAAGGLLVWNSRTVHQGWRGGPRLAQPVCYEPRERRSNAAYQRKLRCAALGLPTTHWASLGLPQYLVKPEPADSANGKVCASIQPQPAIASVTKLWEHLRSPPWDEPLPLELAASLLEESVHEDYRAVL